MSGTHLEGFRDGRLESNRRCGCCARLHAPLEAIPDALHPVSEGALRNPQRLREAAPVVDVGAPLLVAQGPQGTIAWLPADSAARHRSKHARNASPSWSSTAGGTRGSARQGRSSIDTVAGRRRHSSSTSRVIPSRTRARRRSPPPWRSFNVSRSSVSSAHPSDGQAQCQSKNFSSVRRRRSCTHVRGQDRQPSRDSNRSNPTETARRPSSFER